MTTTNTTDSTKRTPAIEVTSSGRMLQLKFSSGQVLIADLDTFTDDIIQQCMVHGLKQKLVDAAAISRDTTTGRSATIEDKYNAVREVLERLQAGEWNKKAEGGGGGSVSLLARAIALVQDKPLDVVRTWLDAKTKEERAALKKNPRVAATILTLQAEAAAKKTNAADSDALLDELGD